MWWRKVKQESLVKESTKQWDNVVINSWFQFKWGVLLYFNTIFGNRIVSVVHVWCCTFLHFSAPSLFLTAKKLPFQGLVVSKSAPNMFFLRIDYLRWPRAHSLLEPAANFLLCRRWIIWIIKVVPPKSRSKKALKTLFVLSCLWVFSMFSACFQCSFYFLICNWRLTSARTHPNNYIDCECSE